MSIAFSLALVAAAADPGRTWIVDQQPRHCMALRARTAERTGVAIRVRPFANHLDLLLLVPKTGARNAYVPVSLSVPPSRPGAEARARMMESAASTDRVVSIGLSQQQLASAIAARAITVDAGKHGTFTASLAGAAKLPAALADCADAVAGGLGLQRTWSTPAVEQNDFVGIMRHDDYPWASIERDQQGGVTALLEIDDKGAITGCRSFDSHGDARFQEAVCKAARKRARFAPARDAAGNAVRSYYLTPTVWFVLE